MQERGRVLSISQIYESIWHMQAIGADNTIAVHIRHIREKIERNPKKNQICESSLGNRIQGRMMESFLSSLLSESIMGVNY